MLEKFVAVIKLTSGEDIVARISELENMDKILVECPAMMNCQSSQRRPGINMIKIETIPERKPDWLKIKLNTSSNYQEMKSLLILCQVVDLQYSE